MSDYPQELETVLRTRAGRAVLWELLSRAGLFHVTFDADPYTNAYRSGRREIMLQLYAELESNHPDLMALARKESADDNARARAERAKPLTPTYGGRIAALANPDLGEPDPYADSADNRSDYASRPGDPEVA